MSRPWLLPFSWSLMSPGIQSQPWGSKSPAMRSRGTTLRTRAPACGESRRDMPPSVMTSSWEGPAGASSELCGTAHDGSEGASAGLIHTRLP